MLKQKMTDEEKERTSSLIASVINDSIHYGHYEKIAIIGRSFDAEYLKHLEEKVQKSANELADYVEKLINSRT